MREFFRGWRRKVGCVLLIMALVLMGGWLRSHFISDILLIGVAVDSDTLLTSTDGGLCWATYTMKFYETAPFLLVSMSRATQRPDQQGHGWWQFKDQCDTDWEWNRLGLVWGKANRTLSNGPASHVNYLLIPYWFITVPLTLLSAYLLLWKPRQRTGAEHA